MSGAALPVGERAVAVVARGPDGPRRGTGVRIGGGRVLTAAHVVRGADEVKVSVDGGFHAVHAQVSTAIDAAVLTLPADLPRLPPMAVFGGAAGGRDAEAWGFPRGGRDQGRFALHPLRGSLDELRYLGGGASDGVLTAAAPPDAAADWSGVSGGPVAVGGALAGLLARVPPQFPGRLTVVPVRALKADPVIGPALAACPPSGARVEHGALRVRVPEVELLHKGQTQLVLLQTAPDPAAWTTDARRPGTVAAIAALLTPGEGLDRVGLGASLVMLPEYALGSGDLDAVDALVRAWGRPLVLYAGVGAVRGDALLRWAGGGRVERVLTEEPVPLRRYNLGLVWVSVPGRTVCCAVFKRFAEQAHERTAIPELALGTRHLVVELADCDLHPVVCADLVQQADGDVVSMLARAVRRDRPQLVLAALWQATPAHPAWQTALRRTVETGAIAIVANVASGRLEPSAPADAWRNLSGVFVDRGTEPDLGHPWPACRTAPAIDRLRGVVVRWSDPCVAVGTLTVPPYGSTAHSRYPWTGFLRAGLGAALEMPEVAGSEQVAATELDRLVRRSDHHPALDVPGAVARLRPTDQAVGTLLNGPDGDAWDDVDAVHRADDLAHGAEALAALVQARAAVDVRPLGQLRWNDRPLAVWRSSEWASGVRQRLAELAFEGHAVTAVAHARGLVEAGEVEAVLEGGEIAPRIRARVDAGLPHEATIDHPDRPAPVVLLPFAELDELLDPGDPSDPGPRVAAWLDGRRP